MLIGLWAACWWIGHVPLTAELRRKIATWTQGAAIAAVVGYGSFTLLTPHDALLPWQPFSNDVLARYHSEGKTVMVDFSADWCLACKTNLRFAINRQEVLELVQANGVVPLLAEWNEDIPPALHQEIKGALNSLGSNSIPVLAIFPASRPDEAIVLRDLISTGRLVDALKQAGPSRSIAQMKDTAMQ
jgi:thiol:disulfide interchange protein